MKINEKIELNALIIAAQRVINAAEQTQDVDNVLARHAARFTRVALWLEARRNKKP